MQLLLEECAILTMFFIKSPHEVFNTSFWYKNFLVAQKKTPNSASLCFDSANPNLDSVNLNHAKIGIISSWATLKKCLKALAGTA